jgi:hypothetical protein
MSSLYAISFHFMITEFFFPTSVNSSRHSIDTPILNG